MLFFLFCLFCVAYPIAVIGVAFNVNPPFSMSWAGSVLLILEGTMMAVAVMDEFAILGLFAIILVAILSYAIEALGVHTRFPFGAYHYTDVLATLLDLLLEPVAFHLEHYWSWLSPGSFNYYGVPISNFIAWFVISSILLFVINSIVLSAIGFVDTTSFIGRLPTRMAALLYAANVFMFGLIDLTHGYYLGVLFAVIAGLLLWIISPFPRYSELTVPIIDSIKQDQLLQRNRKRVKKTKRKKRR